MMIRLRKPVGLLFTILMVIALTGCTYTSPALTAGGEAASAAAVPEKDSVKDTGAPEEVPEAGAVTTGGEPWSDSEIKANLTEDMELSAKDNFYLFANHDWLMSTDIPEGMSAYNTINEAGEKIEDNIVSFMADRNVDGHEAELSQTFYHALLDWEERDKTGFEPALEKITAIKEIKNIDELTSFLCDTRKSCFVFSGIDVLNDTNFDDSSKYIVKIDDIHGDLLLQDSSEYKERTDMGELYYQAMKELSESMLTRAGYSKAEADAVFEGAIEFETLLAQNVPTPAEFYAPEYVAKITNLYDMDGLKELFKAYPIEELLKARGYGGAEQYQVTTPDYASRLGSLYNEENLDKIKDNMLIHFCFKASSKLDREAFEAYNRYMNTAYGTSGKLSDTTYATTIMRRYLPDAIAKAYVDYYHLEESKVKIRKLCMDIIDIYKDMLEGEDWLSEEMKEKAVEKLRCMGVHSVYPDKWTDYDSFEFTGDSLYGYFEQAAVFNMQHDASHTGQTIDKGEWNFIHYNLDPLVTNAVYSPDMNSIYIFAGIVADPIYREDMSDEDFYGHLAMVIAHEISHAFDPVGSQYDKDGNLKNWWNEEDQKAFNERAQKLVDYYDSITIWTGLNASGELYQGETIADMGAMKAILTLAEKKKDFDYETFFKAFAGQWRCLSSREYEYSSATQDPHPVNYLRTNVVVQQFEEFYETFGVKEGDGMYLAPEDRVAVW